MPCSAPIPTSADDILERAEALAQTVFTSTRRTLAVSYRFMDVALWRMPLRAERLARAVATNGYELLYDPVRVIGRFREDANETMRDYLHAILHCVFRHPFDDKHDQTATWDLACDIAVEACAMDLAGARFPSALDERRARALETLKGPCPQLSAPALYILFAENGPQDDGAHDPQSNHAEGLTTRFIASLEGLFARDDHSVWTREPESAARYLKVDHDAWLTGEPTGEKLRGEDQAESDEEDRPARDTVIAAGAPDESAGGMAQEGDVEGGDRFITAASENEADSAYGQMAALMPEALAEEPDWTDISEIVESGLAAFTGQFGTDTGAFSANITLSPRRRAHDFRTFLRRFSALSEELKVSTEEFDYIYYTYGLARFGNMPLVEPLEYEQTRRVRDFVIAIDTSASCTGGLVRHFVERTYDVLRNTAAFGRKVNVHIVQCDSRVRKVVKVTETRELDERFATFEARGFGGTDFRPVFAYVDERVAQREFKNLKGMIYLTDGIGTFPEEKPGYDCVFVFVDEAGAAREVPAWATKVFMDEDTIVEL